MPSNSTQLQVHSLSCTACGKSKDSIMMELCPECERAMLLCYPPDYFKATQAIKEQDLELSALKVLEVLELASIDAPVDLAASDNVLAA